jgi:hypothetical protein
MLAVSMPTALICRSSVNHRAASGARPADLLYKSIRNVGIRRIQFPKRFAVRDLRPAFIANIDPT